MDNTSIFGRILSVHKFLVDGVETIADGVSADGKNAQYFVVRGSTGNNAIVDSNGNLVCMLKGSENIPIAQDAAGNLISVMKGDYGGILDTISIDDHGRMLAVITDPEDIWGNPHQIGLSEAVARIGSLSTFDRRGTVVAYDSFDHYPLNWSSSTGGGGGGTGGYAALSNNYPYRGSGCLRLNAPNKVGDYVWSYRSFGGVFSGMVGIESVILFADVLNHKPSTSFQVNTGSRVIHGGIRIQQMGSGGLSFLQDNSPHVDGSWTPFNNDFLIQKGIPYPIKFVVDVTNEKYVRCMFGGTEIDMSAYTPYVADSTYVQNLSPRYYVVNGTNGNVSTYVDNFVLTIQEPS